MPKIRFKQIGEELANITQICLYNSETAEIRFDDVEFKFSYANVKINNINIGKSTTGQIGIHASKFRDGDNELVVSYFDNDGKLITTLKSVIVKRPSIRGKESIEQEFTMLTEELGKLKIKLAEIESWKNQIDNERSGF